VARRNPRISVNFADFRGFVRSFREVRPVELVDCSLRAASSGHALGSFVSLADRHETSEAKLEQARALFVRNLVEIFTALHTSRVLDSSTAPSLSVAAERSE
jgi:hypothetical protein